MLVSVSILNSNDRIKDTIKLNNTDCDYIHIDVMDGKFVTDKQFDLEEIKKIIETTTKKIDIHLMVNDPEYYINNLKLYNIDFITFHLEIDKDINKLIDLVKKYNIKVGISLKPNTKVSEIKKYLDKIDLVLVMSVEPGYGGQKFIESSLDKVRELRKIIHDNNLNTLIEIDGGVNDTNISKIKDSSVDISVCGSYITKSENFEVNIKKIK